MQPRQKEKVRESIPTLKLEVEEIERRERGRPNCTSSTTSDLCDCLCREP